MIKRFSYLTSHYHALFSPRCECLTTRTIPGRTEILTASSQRRNHSTNFTRSASTSVSLNSNASLHPELTLKPQTANLNRPIPKVYDFSNLPLCTANDNRVHIRWDSLSTSKFHHIWLRDHCRCPNCFHQITKQRLVNTFEIPPDIKPLTVEARPDGLKVTWPSYEPHESFYPWQWLLQNSYDTPLTAAQQRTEKILWGTKIAQDPPTMTYDYVMSDEEGLYKWLEKIDVFGLCFISNVPPTAEATEKLSRRLGIIRETQYGGFWDFTSDLSKGDTAYTNMALRAHTDTTYYTDPCGLQLFHLLSHTDGTGGASLLVDGFYVASVLKELHPEVYRLLSTVRVPAHAAGEASALYTPSPRAGYPILSHDPVSGELIQVRYNNDDRSVMNNISPDLVEDWYKSLRTWNKLLSSSDSEYWIQLSGGTAVVIDNHRVLHGRSAFNGKRRMCGAYIGIDDYRAKLAALREKYVPDSMSTLNETNMINGRSIWSLAF